MNAASSFAASAVAAALFWKGANRFRLISTLTSATAGGRKRSSLTRRNALDQRERTLDFEH